MQSLFLLLLLGLSWLLLPSVEGTATHSRGGRIQPSGHVDGVAPPMVVVDFKTMQGAQPMLQGAAGQGWHMEGILRLPVVPRIDGADRSSSRCSSGTHFEGGCDSGRGSDDDDDVASGTSTTSVHLRSTLPLAWTVPTDASSEVLDVRVFAVSFTYRRRTARGLAAPCSSGPLLATVPVGQLRPDNADAWAWDMRFDGAELQDDEYADDGGVAEHDGVSHSGGPKGFVLSADDGLLGGYDYAAVPFPIGRYFICAAVEVRTQLASASTNPLGGAEAAVERTAIPIASFDVFGWNVAPTPEDPRRVSACTRLRRVGRADTLVNVQQHRSGPSSLRCVIDLEGWFPFSSGAVVELRRGPSATGDDGEGDEGEGGRLLARRSTSFDAPWVSLVQVPVDIDVHTPHEPDLPLDGGAIWVDVVTSERADVPRNAQAPNTVALTVRLHRHGTDRSLFPASSGRVMSNFSVSFPSFDWRVDGPAVDDTMDVIDDGMAEVDDSGGDTQNDVQLSESTDYQEEGDAVTPTPYHVRLAPHPNCTPPPTLLMVDNATGWVLELHIDAVECVEQTLGRCIRGEVQGAPSLGSAAVFNCPFDPRGLWQPPPSAAASNHHGHNSPSASAFVRSPAASIRCKAVDGSTIPVVVSDLYDIDTRPAEATDGLLVVADPSALRVWIYATDLQAAAFIDGVSVVSMGTIASDATHGDERCQGAVHGVPIPVRIEHRTTARGAIEVRVAVYPWNLDWQCVAHLRVSVPALPYAVHRHVPIHRPLHAAAHATWPLPIRLTTTSAPHDAVPTVLVGRVRRPGAPPHYADLLAEYAVRVRKQQGEHPAAHGTHDATLTARMVRSAPDAPQRPVPWDWAHWCGKHDSPPAGCNVSDPDGAWSVPLTVTAGAASDGGGDAADWAWTVSGSPAMLPAHHDDATMPRLVVVFCFSASSNASKQHQLLFAPVIVVAAPEVAPLTASLSMPCPLAAGSGHLDNATTARRAPHGEGHTAAPSSSESCVRCFPSARLVRAPLRAKYDARVTHAADVAASFFCAPPGQAPTAAAGRDDATSVGADVSEVDGGTTHPGGALTMRFNRPSLEALGRSNAPERDARYGPFAICVTINATALALRSQAVRKMWWETLGLVLVSPADAVPLPERPSLVAAHFGFATFAACPTVQAVAIPPPDPLSVDALSEAWWAFFPTNTAKVQRALDAVAQGSARALRARSGHQSSLAALLQRHSLRVVPLPSSLSGRDYTKRYKTHRLCTGTPMEHNASRLAAPVINRRDAELLGDAVAQLYRTVRIEGTVVWLLRTRGPFYGERALCANIDGVEEYVGMLSVPGPWYAAPLPVAPPVVTMPMGDRTAVRPTANISPSQLVFQRFVAHVDDAVRLSFSVVAHSSAEFLRSSLQLVRVEYGDQWGAILGADQTTVPPSSSSASTEPLLGNLDIASPLHYEEVTRAAVPSDVDRVVTATFLPHVPGTYVVCFAKGLAWDDTTKLVSGQQRSQPGKALAAAVRGTVARDSGMKALFDQQDAMRGSTAGGFGDGHHPPELHRLEVLDSLGVAAILGINRTATTHLPTLSDVKMATVLDVLPPRRCADGAITMRQHGGRTHVVVGPAAVARFDRVVGWAVACVPDATSSDDALGGSGPDVDALSFYQGVASARSMIHLSDGALQLGFVLTPSNLCGRSRIVLLAGWRRVARAVRTPYRNQHAQRASVGMDDTVDTQRVVWRMVSRDLALPRDVLDHIVVAHRHRTGHDAPRHRDGSGSGDGEASTTQSPCGGTSVCSTVEVVDATTELFDALDLDLLDGI